MSAPYTSFFANDIPQGDYVCLAVADTGTGMPGDVLEKMFEPFFTTKAAGKGTGLGLATVYGIVRQCNGFIDVDSVVGRGTEFRIFLPKQNPPLNDSPSAETTGGNGNETILLVEDDDSVRAITTTALESHGYNVVAAPGGREALDFLHGRNKIDLLVTDVVMPEMGGRELADKAQTIRPGLPVLYVSGYMDDDVVRSGVRLATDAFVQKPFTPQGLAEKVRSLLDASRRQHNFPAIPGLR